jgi:nitric oxide dioxygenase
LTLARAVAAYAANIDNLSVLGGALKLMANKHAALGIKPEHYPIVGGHLLQAIKDVLGVDAEIIDAWAKAYGFLADVLIGMERELYAAASAQQGGWEDFRTFRVTRKERESENVMSFYLEAADGGRIADFRPGQYITVRVSFPDGGTALRNYSLSDIPNGRHYRISVKREDRPLGRHDLPQGLVSHWLHDQVVPGMELELRAPMGEFCLELNTERPVVLLSGGVGQTPLLAMLKALDRSGSGKEAYFIHGARNPRVHALSEEVRAITEANPSLKAYVAYSEPHPAELNDGACDRVGNVTAEWLESLLPTKDCDFYFCGPKPFMQQVYAILKDWKVPSQQIRFEFFGPAGAIDQAA